MAPEYIYGSAAMGHRITMRHGERERGGGRKKGRKNKKGSMTRARIVLSPCNDELWKEGEEKRKKEKRREDVPLHAKDCGVASRVLQC